MSVRLDIWSTYHYTCSDVEVDYVYPNCHRCRGITDILLKVVFNTIAIHFSPIFLCYRFTAILTPRSAREDHRLYEY